MSHSPTARPPAPPALIDTAEEVREVAKALSETKIIAVDTEFIRETTFFPRIALIQVATKDQTWLLDPVALSPADLGPVLDVFRDKNILKVMHAAFADQECFYWAYHFCAEPVLDTAVAAALVGLGDNAGLGKLLKEVLGVMVAKGRARVKWLARPLPDELLHYAEQDVAHLVNLGEAFIERLNRKSRLEWAMTESHLTPAEFDIPYEEVASRVAKSAQMDPVTYSVLVQLIRWREDRAKRANLPRAWVADNEILVSLAKVRPSHVDELRSFRGLNAKEVDRSGQVILEAIRAGKTNPRGDFPVSKRGPIPTEKEEHILDLVRAYVTYLASQHEIAPRYLLNSAKTLPLVHKGGQAKEEWVKQGILTEKACALVGDDLKELLSGKRALVLREGRVEILSL